MLRDLRRSKAVQLDWAKSHGSITHANQAESDRGDAPQKTVAQHVSADRRGGRNGILDRDRAILPTHHSLIFDVLARLELSVPITVATTPERAFDYFADHRHVAQVLQGVSRWDPLGKQTQGVGARYAVEMRAMGLPLRSVLRLNRWRRPEEIGWISESGLIKQEGSFSFVQAGDTKTRITLRIAYEPPASVLGAAVAQQLDGMVRRRLAAAMERIRDTLES